MHDPELAALQASRTPEWQDISTAPKDGTPVLLWEPEKAVRHDGLVMIGSYCEAVPGPNQVDAGWYDEVSGHYQIQATHWQPLPSPPQVAPLGAPRDYRAYAIRHLQSAIEKEGEAPASSAEHEHQALVALKLSAIPTYQQILDDWKSVDPLGAGAPFRQEQEKGTPDGSSR